MGGLLSAEQLRKALRKRIEDDIARRLGVPTEEVHKPPFADPAARFRWAGRSLPPCPRA
ncbi:hypothetical protein SSP35_14_00930 [Streptomyces sp. NBRC 110611]|uniref:hypothetical protein n=1 Tax=Streptomyces sp. NBRC 110611 TaxID=1621259 RepID=UPI00085834A2|nr:hypothetical protein [Streptomyces sp. NBRC 110611]GAU69759.1 hypothetical protein SSP35_14_00930 [Streptomyces sp. NBRC 110611]